MIYTRKCIECGRYFDIDTSKDKCPECRNKSGDEPNATN